MRKIAIVGANGQLGTDLVKSLSIQSDKFELIPLTHKDIEVADHAKTREILTEMKPEVVINTSAFHRVDDCEELVEKTFQINAFAVRNLAQVCYDIDAVLIYISTDYVFGGDINRRIPYVETDRPMPLGVYGNSKLAGEHFIQVSCRKYFILRSSGLYGVAGSSGKGGNFVERMLQLAQEGEPIRLVNDQVLTPTFTKDLAEKIGNLVQTDAYGLYHATSAGACSWYEFTVKIFEVTGIKANLQPTNSADFKTKAKRPPYSVLDNANLRKQGFADFRPWKDALAEYLEMRKAR